MKQAKRALVEYFTHDASGHRRHRKAPLGVSVTEAAARLCLGLTLTYRAGLHYCCTVPACAFDPDWGRLRELLQAKGVAVEQPLRIFLRCVYERGALVAENPGDRDPVYRPVEEGWLSEQVVDELDGWDPPR